MMPEFEEVAILCPKVVTGGPEAIHQLAHAINMQGGKAGILYYDSPLTSELTDGRLRVSGADAADNPLLETFAQYHPRPLPEAVISPGRLLILPEPLAHWALRPELGACAIWWLSVDNALPEGAPLHDDTLRAQLFADNRIIHYYQSHYARDFLLRHGARRIHPLFDYTDPAFLAAPPPAAAARPPQIAYFPRKGGELAQRLIEQTPDLAFLRIENMTRAQVRQALESCVLYVDFGHHPGKDRVPREAAAAGAIVLLHNAGAGSGFNDHPLSYFHMFNRDDVATGNLAARLRLILDQPGKHFESQRHYRQKIQLEKDEFLLQVRSLFFHPG